jgi:hypothetical protein
MDNPSLVELAGLVADRLPKRHKDWQVYQDAAVVLTQHSR